MKIGIIGGGLMGLALARHFSGRGHAVTVFERGSQLGGLSTYHEYGSFYWDRFYHVILPSDTSLIGFLREIGLEDKLRWRTTLTGYYVEERFHSLSSAWEFLMSPALPWWCKARLALTVLYCARLKDWRALEGISAEEWLIRASGRATFERIWKPLLLAKLGDHYKRVSAVFIWSYIKRIYSARDVGAQKEKLGYVSGGYKTVFARLESSIKSAGGTILTDVAVRHIGRSSGGRLCIVYGGEKAVLDKVIYTGPAGLLEGLASKELVDLGNSGRGVEYLGVVCAVVITKRPLVPFYVVNIADQQVPFTGMIGMTNLVSVEETGGLHVTYLPKYVRSDDPFLRESDEVVWSLFERGLDRMLPSFRDAEVVSVHINRAARVQPLQVLNYSTLAPRVTTRSSDFVVLNTSQFVSNTLNNNEVIRAVNTFLSSDNGLLA